MKTILLNGAIIISTAFFLGLLFYGFYIVLTSKEENHTASQTDDGSGKTVGSKTVPPAKVDPSKTVATTNHPSGAQVPEPAKKTPQRPGKTAKKSRRRAA